MSAGPFPFTTTPWSSHMATKKDTVPPARARRALVHSPQSLSSLPLAEARQADQRVAATDLDDTVDVYVPKAFPFTLDNHQIVQIEIGVQPMPRAWAEHWFVKAQGVITYKRGEH